MELVLLRPLRLPLHSLKLLLRRLRLQPPHPWLLQRLRHHLLPLLRLLRFQRP
jgi:hypothetical protein